MRIVSRSEIELPAFFGGDPAFSEPLAFVRPSVPDADLLIEDVRQILSSRMLTNAGYVAELERRAAEYLQVEHCIAVASCTAGLMLLLRAADLTGDVIVPSFTFAATAHAVAWNGLGVVLADVDPRTLTLSAEACERVIGVRTAAILATHTFGTVCDVEALSSLAERAGIDLFFDAAHAFGSRRGETPVGGQGRAQVFSLSPTKVLIGGEGGIIATDDAALAARCRIGRDYANPGDYDCRYVGLNARMSEFHAALAVRSMQGLDERIERRNQLASSYRDALAEIPGVTFPEVRAGDGTTFKDFTILVEPDAFGADAARLGEALQADGIPTRRYYVPPLHDMTAYRSIARATHPLPVTDWAAERVLTLPLWTEMTEDQVQTVATAVARIQRFVQLLGDRVVRVGDGATREVRA